MFVKEVLNNDHDLVIFSFFIYLCIEGRIIHVACMDYGLTFINR